MSFHADLHFTLRKMDPCGVWGKNHYGQLGVGNYEDQNIPIKIVDENVTQVSTGWEFSMFLKSDGSVWTMGVIGVVSWVLAK